MADNLNLDLLEQLTRAATPGPWMRLFDERTVYDRMEDGCRGNAIVRADTTFGISDAHNLDFIAAANPAALLKLIALARRAAPPVGDDGLPPLSAPKGPFADYSAEEVEAYAKQVQREAYEAGRRTAVPAQTGTQPADDSVDTPEFADLLTVWGNALPGAPALNAAEALIAHIDAWATRRAAVSTASAPVGWKLVPVEPTPEIIAGAAIAAWPTASAADIALARKAAPIVLMQMDGAPGLTADMLAGMLATMAPAYRAMLAAAPSSPVE